MAPSQTQGQDEVIDGGECAGRDNVTELHVDSLFDFVTDLNRASENILKLERIYDRVAALVTYWADDLTDRQHLKKHGSSLWELFKNTYMFEAGESPFELPGNRKLQPNRNLNKKIDDIVFEGGISSEESHNLFILYYGGHATAEFGGDSLWMPKIKSSMSIDWHSIQNLLKEANCDILFLFDCCYGGAMINPKHKWRKRCDLLTSCPPSSDASGIEQESFTWALVCEMEREIVKHKRCDVYMLHNNLNSKRSRDEHSLTRDPTYLSYSRRGGVSISLQPLQNSADGSELQPLKPEELLTLSEARVLFKISFSNPDHSPVLEEWKDFLRNRPSNIAQMKALAYDSRRPSTYPELVRAVTSLHGLFETHSNVAIMSIPVWLWDLLPRHPLIEYITIIRSQNLKQGLPEMFTGEDKTTVPIAATETKTIGQSLPHTHLHTPVRSCPHCTDRENEDPTQGILHRQAKEKCCND